jgi:ABC-type Fe3+ transport system substrate-binding protein
MKISDVDPNDIMLGGYYIAHSDDPLIWVYNTKLVSKNDVPRTWENVLDRRYKGSKISLRSGAGGSVTGLWPAWRENPKKAIDYVKELQKQEIMPADGGNQAAMRIANGECLIGILRASLILELKGQGAPLGVCTISPVVDNPVGFYVPKAKGLQHPNAAKLLISWLYTRESLEVFRKNHRGRATPCDASPIAQLLCDNGLKYVRVGGTFEEQKKFDAFCDAANEVLGFRP